MESDMHLPKYEADTHLPTCGEATNSTPTAEANTTYVFGTSDLPPQWVISEPRPAILRPANAQPSSQNFDIERGAPRKLKKRFRYRQRIIEALSTARDIVWKTLDKCAVGCCVVCYLAGFVVFGIGCIVVLTAGLLICAPFLALYGHTI